MMFVMVSSTSLSDILDIFNKTVQICLHKFSPGVFGLSTQFIFFIQQNETENVYSVSNQVFGLRYFQSSAFVSIAKEMSGKVLFYSYDMFPNTKSESEEDGVVTENLKNLKKRVRLTYIWRKGTPSFHFSKIFTQRTDFKGKQLVVSPMVWSDRVVWSNLTQNYYGFEVELLELCRKILNFKYNVVLAKVPVVFMLSKDKSRYEGAVAEVFDGKADIAIGDSMQFWEVNNLVDSSIPFDSDAFDLLAPMPKTVSGFLATFQPFQKPVWLLVLAILTVSAGAFCLVSKVEGRHGEFKEWNTFTSSLLFCFGTLLSESVSVSNSIRSNANAMR